MAKAKEEWERCNPTVFETRTRWTPELSARMLVVRKRHHQSPERWREFCESVIERRAEKRAAWEAERQAEYDEMQKTLANPFTPWTRELSERFNDVRRRLTPEQWPVFAEAMCDVHEYNLVQSDQATANPKGVAAHRAQWSSIQGGRASKFNIGFIAGGAVIAGICGAIIGPAMVGSFLAGEEGSLFTPQLIGLSAIVAAAVGGYAGHMLSGQGGFHDAMMQVIVNERSTKITPQRVTGQARAWLPKAVLSWRAHEWRYKDGRPYLWLHTPLGTEIHEMLRLPTDYLFLANDRYQAQDAALYDQRSWNRIISEAALDHSEVDEGEDAGKDGILGFMPFISAGAIVVIALLLVLLTG